MTEEDTRTELGRVAAGVLSWMRLMSNPCAKLVWRETTSSPNVFAPELPEYVRRGAIDEIEKQLKSGAVTADKVIESARKANPLHAWLCERGAPGPRAIEDFMVAETARISRPGLRWTASGPRIALEEGTERITLDIRRLCPVMFEIPSSGGADFWDRINRAP
ncbi:MAG TPA: hypothetical protein VGG74_14755 [Kofleriaceae bacterium]|jgi:hypothetical protein